MECLETPAPPDLSCPQWPELTRRMNGAGYREGRHSRWLFPKTKRLLLRWGCVTSICSKDPTASYATLVPSESTPLNPTGSPVTSSGDSQLYGAATFSGKVRLLSFPSPPDRKGKWRGKRPSNHDVKYINTFQLNGLWYSYLNKVIMNTVC